MIFEGQEVFIAVSAGDAEGWTADLHVRPRDVAGVDLVAQGDVGVTARAHVAHCGEAGFERDLRIFDTDDGFLGRGHRDFEEWIEIVGTSEVGVDIDQAWHQRVLAEIDLGVASLSRCRSGGRDGEDGFALDDDGLVGRLRACFYVEDVAGAQQGAGVLRRGRCYCSYQQADQGCG